MANDLSNPIWVVFIFIVLPPIVIWIKKKLRPTKRNCSIIVECPHCGVRNGIERLRNYICSDCNGSVILTKGRDSSEPSDDWPTYQCSSCGTENIQPLCHCLKCKTPRQDEA
ncbi:MAG: hypothetical protein GY794_12250 [bacterium]|nr:hypothetical protein [bacterium]